jgi:hypothetical protein
MDVARGNQADHHVLDESSPPAVREQTGELFGERVKLMPDRRGELPACHGSRLLSWP